MHPDRKQVLPVMPEAIKNTDGTKKQDCETNCRQALHQKFTLGPPTANIYDLW
jgi:hypothetical protein